MKNFKHRAKLKENRVQRTAPPPTMLFHQKSLPSLQGSLPESTPPSAHLFLVCSLQSKRPRQHTPQGTFPHPRLYQEPNIYLGIFILLRENLPVKNWAYVHTTLAELCYICHYICSSDYQDFTPPTKTSPQSVCEPSHQPPPQAEALHTINVVSSTAFCIWNHWVVVQGFHVVWCLWGLSGFADLLSVAFLLLGFYVTLAVLDLALETRMAFDSEIHLPLGLKVCAITTIQPVCSFLLLVLCSIFLSTCLWMMPANLKLW